MLNKVFCIVGEENVVKYLKIEKNHCDPVLNKWNQGIIFFNIIIKRN